MRYLLFLILFVGCVSPAEYQKAIESNSKQRERIKTLTNKNKALSDSIAIMNSKIRLLKDSIEVLSDSLSTYADYQTYDENQIIYYMNYARTKPKEFLKKFVIPNISDSSNYYERTLIDRLRKMKSVNPLTKDRKMFNYAFCHAKESGQSGYVGHNRKTCKGGYSGECCAYGSAGYTSDKALNYVLQLLIDTGVPSLGHREIILMDWLNKVGVSIQPHLTYGENVVIDFN